MKFDRIWWIWGEDRENYWRLASDFWDMDGENLGRLNLFFGNGTRMLNLVEEGASCKLGPGGCLKLAQKMME